MSTKTKRRAPKARQVQTPRRRASETRRRWWLYGGAAVLLIALTAALAATAFTDGSNETDATAGLPNTADYHSLLVSPRNPQRLVLGTHGGLYVSSDGGRHWRFDALAGDDAMNLARPDENVVWLAGHDVFKKSSDGGETWTDVESSGLPTLDIHGFAVDPRNPKNLYAAVAGRGLYRSRDGGRSFSRLSAKVGGNVMALAVLPEGRILAADMQQGLLETSNRGETWKRTLGAQLMGLAVNPANPQRILAAGGGIALSTDGGRSWRSVLDVPGGVGPIAWSESAPKAAYAVAFDRTLYHSTDSGETWQPVEE
jgi:photosystem II stability/assembly factor-like uncharacterized protein